METTKTFVKEEIIFQQGERSKYAYIIESGNEIGIPNLVTSVLASYRGYDTLGEITVIFTACIGVLILLGRSKDDYKGIINKERF